MAMTSDEYVPKKKSFKDEADVATEGLLWMTVEDNERSNHIEKLNEELLEQYPDEYRRYRNEILAEIKLSIDAAYEREKNVHERQVALAFARMLDEEKGKLSRALEQDFEDEMKKTIEKELKYAERKKEAECKRSYAKIKNEMMKAKEEGKRMCLYCGNMDVHFACGCNQAYYCNKTCRKKHSWIHKKCCTRKETN